MKLRKRKIKYAGIFGICWFALSVFLVDGVYTFMIKVARAESGVTKSYVYFENPIVSEHEDDIYFSLRKLMGDEDSAVFKAQKTLDSIVKKSAQTGKIGELVVSDSLYKSLEKEITTAKKLASTIGEKILEGSATSEDAKSILTEIAKLNTIERKVTASIEKTVIEQTIIVNCENKEKGEYLITNLEGGLVRVYVASGKHTTWNEFGKAGYMSVKIDDNNGIKTAAFEVNNNGYYTIYCKFEDNTYKFLQIMEDGYGGENWKEEEKPVEKEAKPIVNTGSCTEAGMSIVLDTSKNNIKWSAFSEGKYNSWKEMLQNNKGGIHYIAQNESVLIPAWTDTSVSYTFFFKGNSNDSDYIVTVSGTNNKKVSTVDESFYEED